MYNEIKQLSELTSSKSLNCNLKNKQKRHTVERQKWQLLVVLENHPDSPIIGVCYGQNNNGEGEDNSYQREQPHHLAA